MKFGNGLYGLVTGLVLVAVSACSPSTEESSAEEYKHTVSEAKAAQWPGSGVEPERLDSVLTRDNYMVVLDMSGSMGSDDCSGSYRDKSSAAKAALDSWVKSVDREANLGLIVFDNRGPQIRVPLGQDNRDRFRQHVNQSSASGGTPLQSSLKLAHEALAERAMSQQGYGTYRLMVITDGAHDSGEDPSLEIGRIAGNPANPIELHTIGFCIDDSALNQPGVTVYRSARNPKELAQGLDSVLAESQDFANIQEFTGNDF